MIISLDQAQEVREKLEYEHQWISQHIPRCPPGVKDEYIALAEKRKTELEKLEIEIAKVQLELAPGLEKYINKESATIEKL